MTAPSANRWKLVASLALVMTGFGFVYWQYRGSSARSSQQTLAEAPVPLAQTPSTTGPPSEDMRQEMIRELELTPEQQERIEVLEKDDGGPSPGNMQARIAAMSQILTPEQMQKFRATLQKAMRRRMEADMKRLPPDEQAKFKAKLEERMKNMPPPGFGPPPEGAPSQ